MRIRPFYLGCTYFRCSGRRLLRPLYTRPQEFCIFKQFISGRSFWALASTLPFCVFDLL